jgi:hypothetical protein
MEYEPVKAQKKLQTDQFNKSLNSCQALLFDYYLTRSQAEF